jgi:hypothetical protein
MDRGAVVKLPGVGDKAKRLRNVPRCPFCGTDDAYFVVTVDLRDAVGCNGCCALGPSAVDKRLARIAWKNRCKVDS